MTEEQDRRAFDVHPHPHYGPCDGFGGDNEWCAYCAEIRWALHDALAAKDAEIEKLREPLAMLYRAYLCGTYEPHPVWEVVHHALGAEADEIRAEVQRAQ